MWQWLDTAIMVFIVLVSAMYAVYALSPVPVKRVLLSWLVRCCGLKVYAWLAPKAGGCSHCSAGSLNALKTKRAVKLPK